MSPRASGLFAIICAALISAACSKSSPAGSGNNADGSGAAASSGGSANSTGGGIGCDDGDTGCLSEPHELYALPESRPAALEADGEFLYWTEILFEDEFSRRGRLVKAPADGSGPITELGPWQGAEVGSQSIATEQGIIYWSDSGTIRRYSLRDNVALDPLTVENDRYSLRVRDDFIYFASETCQTFGRVSIEGGEPHYYSHPQRPTGGSGLLLVDDTHVFCGILESLYAVPHHGTVSTVIASFSTNWESFGPMLDIDGEIFFSKNDGILSAPHQDTLTKIKKNGGEPTDLGLVGVSAAVLRWDKSRKTIYWTTKSSSQADRVMSYDVDADKLTVMAEGNPVYGGNSHDENFVYWVAQNAIMRIAK